MSSVFNGYQPYKGDIQKRTTGSLIAFEAGEAVGYGLFNAQDRGPLFIGPGTMVYEGMIVGENPRGEDMAVNVCKKKQLTNMRASGSDDALRLIPPRQMSIEAALEFISDDELLEITPESIRMRKRCSVQHRASEEDQGRQEVIVATPHGCIFGALRKFCALMLFRLFAIHKVLLQSRA